VKGRRYVVRNYPTTEVADDEPVKVKKEEYIRKDEVLTDDDPRPGAWEIGHLTQGPYALDSWRIFCRDILRGVATGWNGEGSSTSAQPQSQPQSQPQPHPHSQQPSTATFPQEQEPNEGKVFQPEWMRVLPKDKELRAFLRWMWLKEGFEWDPETGEKEVASVEMLRAVGEGRIAWDEKGGLVVCEEEVVEGDLGDVGENK